MRKKKKREKQKTEMVGKEKEKKEEEEEEEEEAKEEKWTPGTCKLHENVNKQQSNLTLQPVVMISTSSPPA